MNDQDSIAPALRRVIDRGDDVATEAVSPSPLALLTDVCRLLHDVIADALPGISRNDQSPVPAHRDALLEMHAPASRVMQALHLHAGLSVHARFATAEAPWPQVDVRVQHVMLSMSTVIGLVEDGAVRDRSRPLCTGRHVRIDVSDAQQPLATLWIPAVGVPTAR